MSLDFLLRIVGSLIMILLSPVFIGVVWRGAGVVKDIQRDVKDIQRDVTNASDRVAEFSARISRQLDDHELRLRNNAGRLDVLWDGHERRRSE